MSEEEKIVIKSVDDSENKSIRDREREVIEKETGETIGGEETPKMVIPRDEDVDSNTDNDDSISDNNSDSNINEDDNENQGLTDDELFKILSERTEREISSFEDLVETKEVEPEELPEDVEAFLKYKKETNRSLKDYIELNKDYDSMSDDDVIMMSYKDKYPNLDEDDLQFKINKDFGYDEDLDDEDDVRQKKIDKRLEASKAREALNEKKGQYQLPLESSGNFVPEDQKEAWEQYLAAKEQEQSILEENQKRSQRFSEYTENIFSDQFKGFEFKVGDNDTLEIPVDNAQKVKEDQWSINNFTSKFLDKDGYLKDEKSAKEYHEALYIARHAKELLDKAYNQGFTRALEKEEKERKNIDMGKKNHKDHRNPNSIRVSEASTRNPNRRRDGGLKVKVRK